MFEMPPPPRIPDRPALAVAPESDSPESSQLIFLTQSSGYRAGLIAKGLLAACNELNLSLLWKDCANFDPATLNGRPIGVVTWAPVPAVRAIMESVGRDVPVVSTNGCTLDLPIPTITVDAGAIGELVAEHLVEEGIEHFVFVGWKTDPSARWRADALQAAVARRTSHFTFEFFDAPGEMMFWGGASGVGGSLVRLLQRSPLPLAIIAMNDQVALSCIQCVQAAGLSMPQQVSVVGVDDHPLYTEAHPLTTVRVDYLGIGRAAAAMITSLGGPEGHGALPFERRFLGGDLIVRQSSQMRMVAEPRIARAVSYMHERYAEEITVAQLARVSGMCRANFAMQFAATIGLSPIKYLISYRLERAKLLLARTTLTISEVGARVGFESLGYFGRAFRGHTGVTPKHFRAQRMTTGQPAAARASGRASAPVRGAVSAMERSSSAA